MTSPHAKVIRLIQKLICSGHHYLTLSSDSLGAFRFPELKDGHVLRPYQFEWFLISVGTVEQVREPNSCAFLLKVSDERTIENIALTKLHNRTKNGHLPEVCVAVIVRSLHDCYVILLQVWFNVQLMLQCIAVFILLHMKSHHYTVSEKKRGQ